MALSRFYEALLHGETGELDPSARDLVERLPHSFQLIFQCLNTTQFTEEFFTQLLSSLAGIISAAGNWIPPEDRMRLFDIYSKALNELQIGRQKTEIAHANRVFAAVFQGFTAILKWYDPPERHSDPLYRGLILEPPRKFLSLGSFTPEAICAFCLFLVEYNKTYGTAGNILINRLVNWQLIAYGFALDHVQLRPTLEKTVKWMIMA
jgi:hypothetical protein